MISITEARKEIQNGGIVVYPTDTVWGMGCDPFNQAAVEKLFQVKGKEKDGLSIMLNHSRIIGDYCEVNQTAEKIIKEFLPGPITLILRSKCNFAKGVTRNGNIAVRIPSNRTALELAKESPVVTTSANRHNSEIAKSMDEAIQTFGSQCVHLAVSTFALMSPGVVEYLFRRCSSGVSSIQSINSKAVFRSHK